MRTSHSFQAVTGDDDESAYFFVFGHSARHYQTKYAQLALGTSSTWAQQSWR